MDNFQEDNIRQPDNAFKETLLEDTRSDFEKQMDEALQLSMQEINQQLNINKKYEEQLLKDYYTEIERRTNIFKNFLFNINKVGKFDNKIEEIYNIIDPIIDSYCGQFIDNCKLDKETYNKIFDTLKQIRNDQQAFDILKTIILIEE
jgi:hypothetical protein